MVDETTPNRGLQLVDVEKAQKRGVAGINASLTTIDTDIQNLFLLLGALPGTADVQAMIDVAVNIMTAGSPELLNVFAEMAAAIDNNPNYAADMDSRLALKANVSDIAALVASSTANLQVAVRRFSGDGFETNFILPTNGINSANVWVQVDGVPQHENTYTVTGTSLVFDAAPGIGSDNIETRIVATAAGVPVPADNSVTPITIAMNAVTAMAIAANSVTTSKINSGAVTTGKLGEGAVTAAKMAPNAVGTANIIDAAINAAKMDGTDAAAIRALIGAITIADVPSSMPVGTILSYAGNGAPAGFFKCNGASFDAVAYPDLNTVLGSNVVPDLRGEFLRGWDDGRGVDSGRGLLSAQGQAYQSHTHGKGSLTGTIYNITASEGNSSGKIDTGGNGSRTWPVTITGSTSASGGSETRPRSIAVHYIIKASA
ncbi:MAG: tail fiber protein [Cohaesibacteraceae bacterium]|nr:tail fiber protein [Cohaesibacteraceae bacterium]MBL4876726.1 tail fiber protein [Cohaesibacteraceae bacterium]